MAARENETMDGRASTTLEKRQKTRVNKATERTHLLSPSERMSCLGAALQRFRVVELGDGCGQGAETKTKNCVLREKCVYRLLRASPG